MKIAFSTDIDSLIFSLIGSPIESSFATKSIIMTNEFVYFGYLVIISWGGIRQFLIKKKGIVIPKWIDYPIVLIAVLWTIYVVYDTFFL